MNLFLSLLTCILLINHTIYAHRNKILFSASYLFHLYFFIQLPLNLIFVIYLDQSFFFINPNTPIGLLHYLFILIVVAQCAFLLLYKIGNENFKNSSRTKLTWSDKRLKIVCLSLIPLGYIAFSYMIYLNGGLTTFIENRGSWRTGGMIGQGWLIFPGTTLVPMACLLLAIHSRDKYPRKHFLMLMLTLLIVAIIPSVLTDFRGSIIVVILYFSFFYHRFIEPIETKYFLLSATTVGLLFIWVTTQRFLNGITGYKNDFHEVNNFLMTNYDLMVYQSLVRSSGSDVLAMVVTKIQNGVPHTYFFPSLYEALTIVIPGAIWPLKPIPQGVRFAEIFYSQANGGISATIVGDGYWNFGIIGVLIVMASIGFICSRFEKRVQDTAISNHSIFTACIFFPLIVWSSESLQGTLNGTVAAFIWMKIIEILISNSTSKDASSSLGH